MPNCPTRSWTRESAVYGCSLIGIGAIPNLVAGLLGDHNVEVFSETISDAVLKLHTPSTIVTSFAIGSECFVDHVDCYPQQFLFCPTTFTNDYRQISSVSKHVSINAVTEMDWTGASICDSINGSVISGIGGQHDFTNGVFQTTGKGKSILVLKSKTSTGIPRIVDRLHSGATIPNYLVDWVVTENGAVQLKGRTLPERRALLERIA